MGENTQCLLGLVCLVVTFRQRKKGFLVVRRKINGLADVGHGLFVFLDPEISMSQSPEGRGIVGILDSCLIKNLNCFFVIFLLKLKNPKVIGRFKIILIHAPGHIKALVGVFGKPQLQCRQAPAQISLKFIGRMAAQFCQCPVGFIRLIPGFFPVVQVSQFRESLRITGVLFQPLFCTF